MIFICFIFVFFWVRVFCLPLLFLLLFSLSPSRSTLRCSLAGFFVSFSSSLSEGLLSDQLCVSPGWAGASGRVWLLRPLVFPLTLEGKDASSDLCRLCSDGCWASGGRPLLFGSDCSCSGQGLLCLLPFEAIWLTWIWCAGSSPVSTGFFLLLAAPCWALAFQGAWV